MKNSQAARLLNSGATSHTADRTAITYRSLAGLETQSEEPALPQPRQVGQIARSIEAFAFNVPMLVDTKHRVVAGNGRIMASNGDADWPGEWIIAELHCPRPQLAPVELQAWRQTQPACPCARLAHLPSQSDHHIESMRG